MAIALYVQYVDHIEPCLLCMLQRVFYVALGLTALVAALHYRARFARYLYNWLALIFTLLGLLAAGRQVWLQHLPPSSQANSFCLPGYKYLIENQAWSVLFKAIFSNAPDCAKISWTFLRLSMAEWSLVLFIVLLLLVLRQFRARSK